MSQAAHTVLEPISRRAPSRGKSERQAKAFRIYAIDLMRSRQSPAADFIAWIVELGFDTLLLALPRHRGSADIDAIPAIASVAAAAGMNVHLDLRLDVAWDDSSAL